MKTKHHSGAFTLIEVMVAAGIVVIIMGVLLAMTDQTQRLVKTTSAKVEQFQEARVAFEAVTRHLAQATLNAFWDYKKSGTTGVPTGYERKAELRFHSGPTKTLNTSVVPGGNQQPGHAVFFQAPIGRVEDTVKLGALDHLMNTWGYFLEIGTDAATLPAFLKAAVPPRKRYRLMELMEPSEQFSVYKFQGDTNNNRWFTTSLSSNTRPVKVLAENIVALIVLPRLSLADEKRITNPILTGKNGINPKTYLYDSTDTGNYNPNVTDNPATNNPLLNTYNQLPPVVQVIMVAIDEPSARRLEDLPGNDKFMGIGYAPDPLTGRTLFANPALLDDTKSNASGDLTTFQNLLTYRKVAYRVFSTNVTIKGSKWSLHTSNN